MKYVEHQTSMRSRYLASDASKGVPGCMARTSNGRKDARMPLNPTVHDRKTGVTPHGEPGGFELALLDRGAAVLQTSAPLRGFDVYVVGFHCVKGEPDVQMEAHHFCKVVNAEMLQCVLFDADDGRS